MLELKKTFKVGTLEFDVAINREIAVDILKHNPKYWELTSKTMKEVSADGGNGYELYSDINRFTEFLENSEQLQDLSAELSKYGLSKLLELARSVITVDGRQLCYKESAEYIIEYCIKNDADMIFNEKVAEFIMLGFTKRATEKTPKVNVALN